MVRKGSPAQRRTLTQADFPHFVVRAAKLPLRGFSCQGHPSFMARSGATTYDPAVDRLVAVTRIYGLAGRRDELRALMRETEQRTSAEPGCRLYRFAATLDD